MNRRIISALALGIVLSLPACSLDGVAPSDQEADEQTQIARAVEQTLAAQIAEPLQSTPDPSAGAPAAPMVSVSIGTNCRSGPGEPYEILGMLNVGQSAEVIGRNTLGDTWIIILPSNPAVTCWLWGQYATVVGDTSGLTVYTPPPTPEPVASFTVSYQNMYHCGGLYGFEFQLTNTGNVTFRSYTAAVFDVTSAVTTKDFSDDVFIDISTECMTLAVLEDLEPGETGSLTNLTLASFHYDLSGHTINAGFKLCSQDGQSGECVEKQISFTP